MVSPRESAQRLGPLFLLATTWSSLTLGLDLNLCASFNTADTPKNISIYQTNGLCHDYCLQDYAFAITQDNACWCSNYAPAKSSQEDLSDCNINCPAYPDEKCGGPGLFGYVSLPNVLPSGTQGPSSAATTEAEPTTVIRQVTETVQNTVTVTPTKSSATTSSKRSTTTQKSTTQTEAKSTAATSSAAEEKPTLIQTVTADGTVKTVTIGPTRTGTTAHDSSQITVKSKGLSTGQVVGIVVGIIGAVIIAAGLCLFFWFRRKKQQRDEQDFQDDPSIRDSSSGMVAGGRPDMSMSGGSPVAAPAATSRNSTLQVDPRMDPFKLYVRNASHESINTLRDEHDYSRKILRATNPDPTPGH